MSLKSRKNGLLNLGKELSRFEMKSIVGGVTQTVCTGGTYNIGCQPGYCSGAGHGSFVACGSYTDCTGGSYAIGCQPGYCSGAGHGSYIGCH